MSASTARQRDANAAPALDEIGGDAGRGDAGRTAPHLALDRDAGGVATRARARVSLPDARVIGRRRGDGAGGEPRVRTVRVALAGCGVVGGALVRLLAGSAEELRARHGLRLELASVLVRDLAKPRPGELDPALLTDDVDVFLSARADVVVEALGGDEPAGRIAEAALEAGRRLVTANKALIATHGPALAALARRHGTRLDFESAVAGGIPVVRALRDSLPLTGIRAVRGILNGTTNYVLSRLEDGWRYADALAKAQALGFAEHDPTRDVSGQDAADKVRILAWLAFGADPASLPVRRRGIVPDPDRLARAAAAAGGVLRSVAEAVRTDDGVAAVVEPIVLSPSADLARVRDEDNAVRVESAWNGAVRFAGPGAGGEATASALLGDVVRAAQRTPPTSPHAARGVDRRRHRWIVGVGGRCGEDAYLRRVLARAEIEAEVVGRAEGDVFARTQPIPWSRADLAFRVLEGAGCRPVIVRDERE